MEFPQKVFQYRYVLQARCTLVINMNLLPKDSSTTLGCTHEWWICFISEENNRFYAGTWQMLQRCCTCPGICIVSCRIYLLVLAWLLTLNSAASLHKWVLTVSMLTNVPCSMLHWSLVTLSYHFTSGDGYLYLAPEHAAWTQSRVEVLYVAGVVKIFMLQ